MIVEKAPGKWGAYAPDLEDSIIATGSTREEAIQNFRDALLELFDDKKELGRDKPDVTALERDGNVGNVGNAACGHCLTSHKIPPP